MTTLARIASALIAAAVFVFPAAAMAEVRTPAGHHGHHDSAFPMKAEAYKKIVAGQVEHLKGHLEKGLEKRSLSPEQKAATIEKSMDGAVKQLHAAVDKVSADGTVTRDEAKQIKDLSDKLRTQMRAELKGKRASAKSKAGKVAAAKVKKGKAAAASKKAEK